MAHPLADRLRRQPPPPRSLQEEAPRVSEGTLQALDTLIPLSAVAVGAGVIAYGRSQGRGWIESGVGGAVAYAGTEIAWVGGLIGAAARAPVVGLAFAAVPLALGVGLPVALLKK